MSLSSGNGRIGLNRLEHSKLRPLAQAHDPTQQHLGVRLERWLREYWQQALQYRIEREYARKHGWGPPCPLRASPTLVKPRKVYKEPRPLSSSKNLRKFR